MFKLNHCIAFSLAGKEIQGTIVGIDKYSLDNFEGKKLCWVSYTLVSDRKGVFSRFWITDWKKDGWVLWTGDKKKKINSFKMVLARSGISKIDFAGDQGVSTPFSGVAVFSINKNTYYAMESFTNTEVLYFNGQQIAKPTVKKSVNAPYNNC